MIDYTRIFLATLPGFVLLICLQLKIEKLKKQNTELEFKNIDLRAKNIESREIISDLKNRDSEKYISDLEKRVSDLKHIIAVYDWEKEKEEK